jgi:hypothetical protein
MIQMRKLIRMVLAASLFTALPCTGAAQNKETSGPAKTSQLAPEMQKLSFMIGEWHYTEKYEKSRMMPDGGTSEGTYRATIGPGGHSILTDFEEKTGPMAGAAGHEVITWDAEKSSYAAYAFVSDGPGCFTRTGGWEKDQLVFTREMNARGKTVRMRFVYTEARADSIAIEVYVGSGDAPLALMFTTRAKKQ